MPGAEGGFAYVPPARQLCVSNALLSPCRPHVPPLFRFCLQLVAAFRATLEEIKDASLLLHVVDVSHPSASAQVRLRLCRMPRLLAPVKPAIGPPCSWEFTRRRPWAAQKSPPPSHSHPSQHAVHHCSQRLPCLHPCLLTSRLTP